MKKLKKVIYKLLNGYSFLPFYLAINISNKCNRQCVFCPYHSPFLKETEHTKWFRSQPDYLSYCNFLLFIINIGIFRCLIKYIAITGKGEPFLNLDIFDYCNLCEKYKIPFGITTNGDALIKSVLDKLSEYKYLNEVRISIYDIVMLKAWITVKNVYPIISLFNQTGYTYNGIKEGYTVQSPGTEQFCSMPKDFNKRNYCQAPFAFMTINTDGSVVPCYSYNEIGNIKTDSFWRIWNGKKMRNYRKAALKMQTERADCKNCGYCI